MSVNTSRGSEKVQPYHCGSPSVVPAPLASGYPTGPCAVPVKPEQKFTFGVLAWVLLLDAWTWGVFSSGKQGHSYFIEKDTKGCEMGVITPNHFTVEERHIWLSLAQRQGPGLSPPNLPTSICVLRAGALSRPTPPSRGLLLSLPRRPDAAAQGWEFSSSGLN